MVFGAGCSSSSASPGAHPSLSPGPFGHRDPGSEATHLVPIPMEVGSALGTAHQFPAFGRCSRAAGRAVGLPQLCERTKPPKVTPKLLEGNSKKSPLARGPACRTRLSPPASPQWDGDLWAPPSLPSPASSPEQVSCTRTCTRCWARTKAKAPAEIVSSSRGREQDYFCTKCNPGISQLLSFAALKTLSQRRARAQFLQTPTRARSWSGPALF